MARREGFASTALPRDGTCAEGAAQPPTLGSKYHAGVSNNGDLRQGRGRGLQETALSCAQDGPSGRRRPLGDPRGRSVSAATHSLGSSLRGRRRRTLLFRDGARYRSGNSRDRASGQRPNVLQCIGQHPGYTETRLTLECNHSA
jgi:hypothetical protein